MLPQTTPTLKTGLHGIDVGKSMNKHITRQQIITEALSWVGTPYQHQCSTKYAGCDCLGLVRGVWRTLYGFEPAPLPPYSPDWAEVGGAETLRDAAAHYLDPIPLDQAKPGDVILFRMRADVPAKHMAILLDEDLIVHAYWGCAVTKSFLAPYWVRRRVAAYAFPHLSPTS